VNLGRTALLSRPTGAGRLRGAVLPAPRIVAYGLIRDLQAEQGQVILRGRVHKQVPGQPGDQVLDRQSLVAGGAGQQAVGPGRLALVLEGGYDLDALRLSVGAALASVLGRRFRPEAASSGGPGIDAVAAARKVHGPDARAEGAPSDGGGAR